MDCAELSFVIVVLIMDFKKNKQNLFSFVTHLDLLYGSKMKSRTCDPFTNGQKTVPLADGGKLDASMVTLTVCPRPILVLSKLMFTCCCPADAAMSEMQMQFIRRCIV